MLIEVTIKVDEATVASVSGQNSVNDAISAELGWLQESGMSVVNWKKVCE